MAARHGDVFFITVMRYNAVSKLTDACGVVVQQCIFVPEAMRQEVTLQVDTLAPRPKVPMYAQHFNALSLKKRS